MSWPETKNRYLQTMALNGQIAFLEFSDLVHFAKGLNSTMLNIYDPVDEGIIFCNSASSLISGLCCEKLFRDNWQFWLSLVPIGQRPVIKERLFNYFKTPTHANPLKFRYSVSNAGQSYVFEHSCLPIMHKTKLLFLSYFKDVTEAQKIEQFLNMNALGKRQSKASLCSRVSVREQQVLQLIADGFSSKQIADRLCISQHTAISHRKHLIQKFQVKNTAQLIKEASKLVDL